MNEAEKLVVTAEQKKQWIAEFNATGKLPSTRISCNKCNAAVTATHSNLATKIKKYQGIENLLNKFVCRTCTDAVKPPKEVKAKKIKFKRKEATQDSNGITKDEHGRYNIPLINMNPERKPLSIADIAKSASLTIEFTKGSCLCPVLYLDNDSCCDGCLLFENCACLCKRLSKKALKALESNRL